MVQLRYLDHKILHFCHSVYPATLELLKQLMEQLTLQAFHLVGGTVLHLGERISMDIDMFSSQTFDSQELLQVLIAEFSNT